MRLAALAVLAVALVGCGGKKAIPASLGTTNATTTIDEQGCHPVKTPDPEERHAPKPTKPLDASKTYDVTLETNCGSITIRLDVKDSPHTTASFVSLVRRGFLLQTIFHRIVPGFVIQGGDPTGTGTGGPGYHLKSEFNDTKHERGILSMARASDPNSAGSQFFIMHGNAPHLDGKYTAFGKVTEGMDVVEEISHVDTDMQDRPLDEIRIESVSLGA